MIANETYLISYLGGTCGFFIKQLIIRILHNRNDPILGENGNAHESNLLYYENIKVDSEYHNLTLQNTWEKSILEFVTPHRSIHPMIVSDHCSPNWEYMFENFPNSKNIIIQCNISNLEHILGNMFFKVNILRPNIWARFKNNFAPTIENPEELTPGIIETFIKTSAMLGRDQAYLKYPFKEGDTIPEIYKDRILVITFDQILNDPNLIMDKLSTFIGKDLPTNLPNLYQIYLDRQKELIDTKMPWLNTLPK